MGNSNFAEVGSRYLCRRHRRGVLTPIFISNFGVRVYNLGANVDENSEDLRTVLKQEKFSRGGAEGNLATDLIFAEEEWRLGKAGRNLQ